jgi:hypothetical protein
MAQLQRPRKPRPEFKSQTQEKSRSVTVKVGDPLEYRVSRLFTHLGFFVRRGRELYTVGRLDTATDLDVLAIRYSEPFHREVQISECKGGGEGPLDRLFWLSGVKRYVGASHATLVRRSTKWNIKDFASELGVEVLDFPRLEELEKASGIDEAVWPGASDRDYYASRQAEWTQVLSRNQALGELYATLAGEVRFHDPFGGINYLLYQLRSLTRDLRDERSASESLTRFLLAESVAQLAMFFMRVAEMTIGLSQEDRDGLIRKGLTYGHIDAGLVDRIFRNAHRITSEMVKHNTGRNIQVDQSFFSMPEPPNVKDIQGVVRMLVTRPVVATTFGPIVDLLVQERFLKQRNGTDWLTKIFPYSNLRDRVSLVHDYLRVLRGIDAVPEILFSSEKPRPAGTSEGQGPEVALVPASARAPADPKDETPKQTSAVPGGSEGADTRTKGSATLEQNNESKGESGSARLFE